MHLAWDPEIDTPATIAVIGAGPAGVEAALYARFLGYEVLLLERGRVGQQQLSWGNHPLPMTWSQATSPLGLAALEAQGTPLAATLLDARPSYREYVEQYLLKVARSDLLYDSVQIHTSVTSISRSGCRSSDEVGLERRAEQEFRVLCDSRQRGEYSQLVDVVLDCSGRPTPTGLATGGGWAIGEQTHLGQMHRGRVDVLGKHRDAYQGKHTLVFGNDELARGNVSDLQLLASQVTGTRVTWIVPKVPGIKQAALEAECQAQLRERPASQALAAEQPLSASVVILPAWGIEAVEYAEQWRVRVQHQEDESLDLVADQFINCLARGPDWKAVEPLQLDVAAITDCVTAEPHYYVVGGKLSGQADMGCELWEHIRRVFALIGGRADLDLYSLLRRQQQQL